MKKHCTGRVAAAVAAAALVLVGCEREGAPEAVAPPAEEDRLVVYTSHKEEVYRPIVREFEERTGIWVELHTGGTSELLEEIGASQGEFCCDVMFGGGVESYNAYKSCFEPYVCSRMEDVKEQHRCEDGSWTPFTELPIVIIYNNKLVAAEEAPGSWQELFYERWKGSIAFADPLKSGSSYTILATMIQVVGMEPEVTLRQFARALDGKVSPGSGEAVEEVVSGVRTVGVTLEETALKAIAGGGDLSIVYPAEGTSAVSDGCAIVSGARHRENAERFIEFILGEDVQRLASDLLCRRSVYRDTDAEAARDIRLIDFDMEWASGHREGFLGLWSELMRQ